EQGGGGCAKQPRREDADESPEPRRGHRLRHEIRLHRKALIESAHFAEGLGIPIEKSVRLTRDCASRGEIACIARPKSRLPELADARLSKSDGVFGWGIFRELLDEMRGAYSDARGADRSDRAQVRLDAAQLRILRSLFCTARGVFEKASGRIEAPIAVCSTAHEPHLNCVLDPVL